MNYRRPHPRFNPFLKPHYIRDTSRWPWKPAEAWQFWRPRSGMVGGLIMAVVLFLLGWPLAYLLSR